MPDWREPCPDLPGPLIANHVAPTLRTAVGEASTSHLLCVAERVESALGAQENAPDPQGLLSLLLGGSTSSNVPGVSVALEQRPH